MCHSPAVSRFVLGPNLVSLKGYVNVRRDTAVIYQ